MFQATRLHRKHDSPQPTPAAACVGVESPDGDLIDESDLALLEELDDVIFGALEGDPEALDRSAKLWRRLKDEAPEKLVEESREQYVRRALAICERYRYEPCDTIAKRFAAMEILTLLAE